MKVTLFKKDVGEYDITEAVTSLEWSGSIQTVSRTFTFGLINAPYDSNVSVPKVALGDVISFYTDDILFKGTVYDAERANTTGTVSFTCYDFGYYLTRSKWSKNFANTTAEAITKQICTEVGLTAGKIAETGVNVSKLLIDSETYYDTILKAYKIAEKTTKKHYNVVVVENVLNVIEMTRVTNGIVLSDDSNITEVNIKEKNSDMVNKVVIYDANGKKIGEVKDDDSINKYGIFQSTYKVEKGVDQNSGAKAEFVKPTQTMTLNCIGDYDAISGYSIIVSDSATGLSGEYWITNDKHSVENGVHMMDLTISYECPVIGGVSA